MQITNETIEVALEGKRLRCIKYPRGEFEEIVLDRKAKKDELKNGTLVLVKLRDRKSLVKGR